MDDAFPLTREMGCTPEEFLRWLPGATRHVPAEIGSGTATVHTGGGSVVIVFRPLPPRKIALVSVPVLEVKFRFAGMDAASRKEFLAYFDLYTKRGGG